MFRRETVCRSLLNVIQIRRGLCFCYFFLQQITVNIKSPKYIKRYIEMASSVVFALRNNTYHQWILLPFLIMGFYTQTFASSAPVSKHMGSQSSWVNPRASLGLRQQNLTELSPKYRSCQGRDIGNTFDREAYRAFRQSLSQKVVNRIKGRIFHYQSLRDCIQWFEQKEVKEIKSPDFCNRVTKEYRQMLKLYWSPMRINLSLARPAIRSDRLISDRSTWLDRTPEHLISAIDFSSLSELTEEEWETSQDIFIERVTEVPVKYFNAEELRDALKKRKSLGPFSSIKYLTSSDRSRIREAVERLRKEAREEYFKILGVAPVLSYLQREEDINDNDKLEAAILNIQKSLEDLLEKSLFPQAKTSNLLAFKPIVESTLEENPSYCPVAERARDRFEKQERANIYISLAAGGILAVPCLFSAPLCLAGGLALGLIGWYEADKALKESLERALTGEDIEKFSHLEERQKAVLIEKIFFPLAFFGTTAQTLVALKRIVPNTFLRGRPVRHTHQSSHKLKGNSFIQRAKGYGREVLDSKGRRLFLKSVETDDGDIMWSGFLKRHEPNFKKTGVRSYLSHILNYTPRKVGGLLSGNTGYTFTPFNGIYNVTFRQPVIYLSRNLTGTEFEPAFFFKFPPVLALSISAYIGADLAYQAELERHIEDEISQHSAQYDNMIRSDFRYRRIKQSLKNGEITQEEARREAYMIGLAYAQYFQYRDAQSSKPTLESEMDLLDHYLFVHLKPVIENGVAQAKGYKVPDRALGSIDESQILSLFQNSHQRYLKYQIIIEMVEESELFFQMKESPQFKDVIASIEDDSFTIILYELLDQGLITSQELKGYLQEDAYWKNRFQDWQTIGVTRLRFDGKNFLDVPLTIEDIRAEILNEIHNG